MAALGWLQNLAIGADAVTGGDTTPDAFTFTDLTEQELGATVDSNTITVTGINDTTPVNFLETGHLSGLYSKNGGAWTDLAIITVVVNDTLALRLTTSPDQNTTHSIKVTIGGVTDTWDVTTVETWTVQSDDASTWTDQTDDTTVWTDQTDDSTTWTDQ